MEEFIGSVWHRFLLTRARLEDQQTQASLAHLRGELAIYFRAYGGDPGKTIEASTEKWYPQHRRIIDIIGGRQHLFPAWQDERSLRLPPTLGITSDSASNHWVYYWLTALAAVITTEPIVLNLECLSLSWIKSNLRASSALLTNKPGLLQNYQQLLLHYGQQRLNYLNTNAGKHKQSGLIETELLLQRYLQAPLSINNAELDTATLEKLQQAILNLPVMIWIYPAKLNKSGLANTEDELENNSDSQTGAAEALNIGRKRAQRIDDKKDTDGLLVFKLESLFSWTEQVNLDRPQDEDVDDQAASAAEDMDIINLSRQRRASAGKLKFDLDLPSAQHDDLAIGEGIKLPEWDFRKRREKPDFCLLQPLLADDAEPQPFPPELLPELRHVSRYFAQLNPEPQWQNRQLQGSELDIDAWIERQTDQLTQEPMLACFRDRQSSFRDLSCLLLADISMLTEAAINDQLRVIDLIKQGLLIFAEAVAATEDQLAIYGFSSIKNKQVRFHIIKNFAERYGAQVRGRIQALRPGYYTRMGSAVRQATQVLKLQSSMQKLLLILSDGKPNDLDIYEGRYGIEDTREAILQARRSGLIPYCITIDQEGSEYLDYIFGNQGYAIVKQPQTLLSMLPRLYAQLTCA